MKPWTLALPRFKCPYCGGTLHVSFRGRWRLPRLRRVKGEQPSKAALFPEERGLDRGEEASSPDAAASAAEAAEEGGE